jgi:dUTP pyrophosphatase
MRTCYPTIRVKLDDGAFLLNRAHDTDAGADIFTPRDVNVPPSRANENGTVDIGYAIVHTGVHVELPENSAGMLKSKSGLNVKHGIISEGVIDQGYGGEIVVKLYNLTGSPVTFPRGSKITQLCVMPVMYPSFRQVDEIGAGERGNGGFGSTGISGGERL